MDESRVYLQARVLFFEDIPEKSSSDDAKQVQEVLRSLERLDRLLNASRDYDELARLDIGQLSFLIPGVEGFTHEERQQFLETTSPRRRLLKCCNILQNVIQRAQINLDIESTIGGNGDLQALLSKLKDAADRLGLP